MFNPFFIVVDLWAIAAGNRLPVTGRALGGRTSGASRRWFCPKSYASVCVGEV